MSYETLQVEREGHITWLILNRPDALNAMNTTLIREVSDFFRGLIDDRQTRVAGSFARCAGSGESHPGA